VFLFVAVVVELVVEHTTKMMILVVVLEDEKLHCKQKEKIRIHF
jgi:hypothetical protein